VLGKGWSFLIGDIYQAVCRLVSFSRYSHHYLFAVRVLSQFYVLCLQSCTSEAGVSEILLEIVSEWWRTAPCDGLISKWEGFTLAGCYKVWFNDSCGLLQRSLNVDAYIKCCKVNFVLNLNHFLHFNEFLELLFFFGKWILFQAGIFCLDEKAFWVKFRLLQLELLCFVPFISHYIWGKTLNLLFL